MNSPSHRSPRSSIVLASLLATVLAGCASKPAPGKLAKDWSCKMREMQIAPLFPPREDMQVGDIYWLPKVGATDSAAYCQPANGNDGFLPLPVHMAHIPAITQSAHDHYLARPDFPKTASAAGTVTIHSNGAATLAFPPASTGSLEGPDTLFQKGRANRTRIVGFPDFLSVSIDRASLGAIVPIQGLFTSSGFSVEDIEEASISIPVAESYGVPVVNAMEKFDEANRKKICALSRSLQKANGKAGSPALVHEVFYTRAIDVGISSRKASALAVALNQQSTGTAASPIITSSQVTVSAGTMTPGAAASAAQIDAVTQGVAKVLESRNGVPGVSLAIEQGRSSTISMRRIFDRPVAIGFRFVELEHPLSDDNCTLDPKVTDGGLGPANTRGKVE